MAFSSVPFLYVFLPLAWVAGLLLPRAARNTALALFSLLFCLWGGGRSSLLLLLAMALGNWAAGLVLARCRQNGPRAGRALLVLAVAADLVPLCLCKYAAFLAQNVNALVPGLLPVEALRLALPLGLSFYTFQCIAYCVDVWRGSCLPERQPLRFLLFLGFFGHLPSGPILRYADQAAALAPQAPQRRVNAVCFAYGAKRFILGLAKKAILADQLALLYSRATAVPAATVPGSVLLLGYTAFMLELYFDFSGYSDMALGLGAMFGLPVPENFDLPYLSRSIAEFWRRWHITLGAWFREYVYFPLGGSRGGTARTCRNLLVVFLLTGLWHGAAWQFIAFGLVHGAVRCAERLARRPAPAWLGHVYTLATVFVGWVFFGAASLTEALAALRGMLTWQPGAAGMTFTAFADPKLLLLLAAGAALCGPVQALCPRLKAALRSQDPPTLPMMLLLAVLLFFSLMRISAGTYSGFIYAQF